MNPYKGNPIVRSITATMNAQAELSIKLYQGRQAFAEQALSNSENNGKIEGKTNPALQGRHL